MRRASSPETDAMTITRRATLSQRLLPLGLALTVAPWLPGTAPVSAGEVQVKPITFPSPFLDGAETAALDRVLEASGVQPIGDGRLMLVAHDKKVPLRVIETATGRPTGAPLVSPGFPQETPKSAKWEGMARDSEAAYYVVGSHSGKTADERNQHAKLLRFRLTGPTAAPTIDDASVVSWRIDAGLVKALKDQGLSQTAIDQRKIEGLAIRETETAGKPRRELVIGLRQPDDLVRAFATDLSGPPAADAELPTAPLFAFEPGSREGVRSQLTSLEYLPAWHGFLVVTTTEDDLNAFHGNTLWFVADDAIAAAGGATTVAEQLWVFEAAMKAEGICVLPAPPEAAAAAPNTVRLLIAYDNDPHATHIPSRFQIVELTRPARFAARP